MDRRRGPKPAGRGRTRLRRRVHDGRRGRHATVQRPPVCRRTRRGRVTPAREVAASTARPALEDVPARFARAAGGAGVAPPARARHPHARAARGRRAAKRRTPRGRGAREAVPRGRRDGEHVAPVRRGAGGVARPRAVAGALARRGLPPRRLLPQERARRPRDARGGAHRRAVRTRLDRPRARDLAQWAVGLEALGVEDPLAFLAPYAEAAGFGLGPDLEASVRPLRTRILARKAARRAGQAHREPGGAPLPVPLPPDPEPVVRRIRPLVGPDGARCAASDDTATGPKALN